MEAWQIALIALTVLIVLLGGILVPTRVAYKMTFYSDRRKKRDPYRAIEHESFDKVREACRANIDALYSAPSEELSVSSHDGLLLKGHFYKGKDGAPYDLMFHGYKSSAYLDFSGGAVECIRRGHNVLLIDQRAHGESEGRTISFGVLESRDVHTWVEYAEERFGDNIKIMLWGISMGAATVLSSLALPFPPSVVGAVADCPFSSPLDIITKVASGMGLPRFIVPALMRSAAFIWGGFRIGRLCAKEAVKNAEIPILLIHGDADGFVPRYMSDEIAEAARTVGASLEYHVFPGADHAMSYLSDREGYVALTDAFVERVLNASTN